MKNFYLCNGIFLLFLFGCVKENHVDPVYVESKDKKLATNYYKMGMLELGEDDNREISYRKALCYVEKALAKDRNPTYMAQKATLLFLLDQTKDSLKCFQSALRMPMPASVKAEILNNYACVVAKSGDRKKAMSLFEELEKDKHYLTPEVALVNQARIYYDEGTFALAKEKLDCAVRFAPDYIDAHYYLGLVCYKMEDYGAALQALDKTIRLESKHKGAIALREQCCEKLVIC